MLREVKLMENRIMVMGIHEALSEYDLGLLGEAGFGQKMVDSAFLYLSYTPMNPNLSPLSAPSDGSGVSIMIGLE